MAGDFSPNKQGSYSKFSGESLFAVGLDYTANSKLEMLSMPKSYSLEVWNMPFNTVNMLRQSASTYTFLPADWSEHPPVLDPVMLYATRFCCITLRVKFRVEISISFCAVICTYRAWEGYIVVTNWLYYTFFFFFSCTGYQLVAPTAQVCLGKRNLPTITASGIPWQCLVARSSVD